MSNRETYWKLTEENDWEGETWYHYFVDGPGVLQALESAMEIEDADYVDLEKVELSEDEAIGLANIDEGNYMSPHWFGELDIAKLAAAESLYKGQIRDCAEEIFDTIIVPSGK